MSPTVDYSATIAVEPSGTRTLYLLPDVPDRAPYPVKEGIARRRIVALTGACLCGAIFDRDRAERSDSLAIEHERRCPASDRALRRALRRWR